MPDQALIDVHRLNERGQYAEALSVSASLDATNTQDVAGIHLARAIAYIGLQRTSEALAAIDCALDGSHVAEQARIAADLALKAAGLPAHFIVFCDVAQKHPKFDWKSYTRRLQADRPDDPVAALPAAWLAARNDDAAELEQAVRRTLEAIPLPEWVADHLIQLKTPMVPRLLASGAKALERIGSMSRALERSRLAAASARALGRSFWPETAWYYVALASAAATQGHLEEALNALDTAREAVEDDSFGRAIVELERGRALREANPEQASTHLRGALELARRCASTQLEGSVWLELARLDRGFGRYEEAHSTLENARARLPSADLSLVDAEEASLCADQSDIEQAIFLVRRAISQTPPETRAYALRNMELAGYLVGAKQFKPAIETARVALAWFAQEIDSSPERTHAQEILRAAEAEGGA